MKRTVQILSRVYIMWKYRALLRKCYNLVEKGIIEKERNVTITEEEVLAVKDLDAIYRFYRVAPIFELYNNLKMLEEVLEK